MPPNSGGRGDLLDHSAGDAQSYFYNDGNIDYWTIHPSLNGLMTMILLILTLSNQQAKESFRITEIFKVRKWFKDYFSPIAALGW